MNRTKIPWCDWTWNPIVGCSPKSEGCLNCYAATISRRFGLPWGTPHFLPARLWDPEKMKRPSRIFVCSMSDLFHEKALRQWQHEILHIIRKNPRHTFILLTKRPRRMSDYFDRHGCPDNVWVGCSAETQERYEQRWPHIARIQARVRFVSIEPILGRIDLDQVEAARLPDWVICGPETGPKAREFDPDWINRLSARSIAFFDKRDGAMRREWPVTDGTDEKGGAT